LLNDYAKFVDTTTSNESKSEYAFGEHFMRLGRQHPDIGWSRLMTSAIGMLAESGEFAEVMKKILFQGKEMNEENRFHMKRELGDVLWYWIQGCIALGYTPEEVMQENIKKLEKRYPNGFEVARSENREVGDI
jgi:NTP pyrophosphatase (non-canonical NTP hydrolase)|tara:strand:- start:29 stop:427 length:399 start_codon:yes stop_codon:yes gene_type:complete